MKSSPSYTICVLLFGFEECFIDHCFRCLDIIPEDNKNIKKTTQYTVLYMPSNCQSYVKFICVFVCVCFLFPFSLALLDLLFVSLVAEYRHLCLFEFSSYLLCIYTPGSVQFSSLMVLVNIWSYVVSAFFSWHFFSVDSSCLLKALLLYILHHMFVIHKHLCDTNVFK